MAAAKEPKTVGEIIENMPKAAATEPHHPQAAVYRSIAAVMAALGEQGIGKDKQSGSDGGGPKFKYRGVDQVYAALNPLLAQHNLVILPRVINRQVTEKVNSKGNALFYTVLSVEFDFVSTEDGTTHTVATIGEAMDSGDKSSAKAMSIAYKYAAFLTFCIPVEGQDDDPDATVHEVAADNGRAPAKGAAAKAAPATDKGAEEAYLDGKEGMEAAADMAALKKAFDSIDWSKIPAGWKPHLVKIKDERIAELKRPSTRPAVPPSFDDGPPSDGAPGDDVPF